MVGHNGSAGVTAGCLTLSPAACFSFTIMPKYDRLSAEMFKNMRGKH